MSPIRARSGATVAAGIFLLGVLVWLGLCLLEYREILILESHSPDSPLQVRVIARPQSFHLMPVSDGFMDVVAEFTQDVSGERWGVTINTDVPSKSSRRQFDEASWESGLLRLQRNGWLTVVIDPSQGKIVKRFYPR
jgi:hypothetical protein